MAASPASAEYRSDPDDTTGFTPTAADLIGVGSDTTQHAMHLIADAWNADASHTFKIASYAATEGGAPQTAGNTITLPDGSSIARPNGSGAGKTRLYNPSTAGIDFARSSDALTSSATVPAGNPEIENGLKAFPFALDTVVMAVSGTTASNAPASITVAQLVDIYECKSTADNWSELGGAPGTIVPQVPQASSGTAKFFKKQLDTAKGSTLTYGGCVDQTVQEHDDSTVKGNANAIVPISQGRAQLKGGTVRIETGFAAKRALYNVVRGADVTNASIQSVFGANGFVCSAAANALIKQAGFDQLATPAHGGVCGSPVDSTNNFTLNAPVTTTTSIAATSPAANAVKLVAQVSGGTTPTGSVSFYEGATLLQASVPLVSGQATLSKSAVSTGSHTYRAVYSPSDAVFLKSEGTATVTVAGPVVKTKAAISETFPAKVKLKKAKSVSVKGVVTVKGATGKVTVKNGKKTLKSATLKGGKVSVKLPKLKKGTYKLTIAYSGDAKHLGGTKKFTVKIVK
jgi:hypothetical protein